MSHTRHGSAAARTSAAASNSLNSALDALFVVATHDKCSWAPSLSAVGSLCTATRHSCVLWDGLARVAHGRYRRTNLMYACATGNAARAAWLAARLPPHLVDAVDVRQDHTALQHAVHSLTASRDSRDSSPGGLPPLPPHRAVAIIEVLLAAGADPLASHEVTGCSALCEACSAGDMELLRLLLSTAPAGKHFYTAVRMPSSYTGSRITGLRGYDEHPPDLALPSSSSSSSTFRASELMLGLVELIESDNLEGAQLLLAAGARVDTWGSVAECVTSSFKRLPTPLFLASSAPMAHLLVGAGVDPSATSQQLYTGRDAGRMREAEQFEQGHRIEQVDALGLLVDGAMCSGAAANIEAVRQLAASGLFDTAAAVACANARRFRPAFKVSRIFGPPTTFPRKSDLAFADVRAEVLAALGVQRGSSQGGGAAAAAAAATGGGRRPREEPSDSKAPQRQRRE